MLEELDSYQVRDTYYIYFMVMFIFFLWLSWHCVWFVLGAPLYVPRLEEDDKYIRQAFCQAQEECILVIQFGM